VGESIRLVDLVQTRIALFLDDRSLILRSISDDLSPLQQFSREYLSGGKRFRALFCYWGWLSVDNPDLESSLIIDAAASESLESVIAAASALEIFHAAALVHDDIIDKSDTRRGGSSAHRRFEQLHGESGWSGTASEFGTNSAILLGDLLLGWSDELLDEGLDLIGDLERRRATRLEYNRMRTEVTAGQYLDILDERAWNVQSEDDLLTRAERVIVFKSAKYSVESPLVIGASIAGARPDQIAALRAFGLPLGIAYQLRDDLLGVFGDAAVTGKPSGDDLREGKRTVLIALARRALPSGARHLLDELLGDEGLNDQQIQMLQQTIRESGAVDEVEAMISKNVERALVAIERAPLALQARTQLGELANTVTRREA
jgi:geranylgeranyl diphosphate synthase type I